MEYFREYMHNQINKSDLNIKIIINKNTTNPFILFEKDSILNSHTLFNLLDLYKFTDDILIKLLSENNLKKIRQHLLNASYIFRENIIFNQIDLCNNFFLGKKSIQKDIIELSKNIKKNKIQKLIDFSLKINPYKIERVVFSGGGSKGMIYLGVILGLFTSGSIFYLNYFSGTSIGALTATLLAMITPSIETYELIKNKSLKEIQKDTQLLESYKKCINFIIERFISRPIDTFYKSPNFTFSSIYETVKKIIYQNYLYDFENSGFGIWYGLICKYICKIMDNNLDKLILIKDKEDRFINIDEIDFESDFEGWKIERFFTFDEYNKITGKSIVLTGTKWDPIETVYYSKEEYKNTSIIKACNASSCLPGVFKPVIINNTNNLDGGLYDNYPLTYGDKKINNRIIEYHNKTIGFLIDDQNSIIDPYEIIRELWLLYNGFINNSVVSYLMDTEKYNDICEIFFEIRLILFKLLYSPNSEINFIYDNIISIQYKIKEKESLKILEINKINIRDILNNLKYDDIINIGKKTNLNDIYDNIFKHGYYYNILINMIQTEYNNINKLNNLSEDNLILNEYKDVLDKLKSILSFYELKGLFYMNKNIENMSEEFIYLIIELKKYTISLQNITEEEIVKINKKNKSNIKNYIKNILDMSNTTLQKILIKVTNKNKNISPPKKESYYNKIINKIYNSNISDIIYKYICIANDKICIDTMNMMRTVKLNTFETNTLHFEIDLELISRLIFEGYSKTLKHFILIMYLIEITGIDKTDDEYLESYEMKYKKLIKFN